MNDFLLEIGTEELPPKLLHTYAKNLAQAIRAELEIQQIAHEQITPFAAPRRLAVLITNLNSQSAAKEIERIGPAITANAKAKEGFSKSCGTELEKLGEKNGKLFFSYQEPPKKTIALLPEIINQAIKNLHINKPMRWADHEVEFIRPVHWVLMLYGKDVVQAEILGQQADRFSYGHRFLAPEKIKISQSDDYVQMLENAYVMVDFQERQKHIIDTIEKIAQSKNAQPVFNSDLLNEVTAIVEWPQVLLASFDQRFLSVPKEAIISVMHGHQKSFPLVNGDGALLPHFIFVANLPSKDPQQVIIGNEKVMRARLSDAKFFFETDLKTPLEQHLTALKKVVFQEKLGTMFDRVTRITALAKFIAQQLGANVQQVERAAQLAKCDLMTNMVYEFPELQGVMGKYYAEAAGEDNSVCQAIVQHYKPMFAGDSLPADVIAMSVALADKLDLLTGIFSIGQKPTGDKDPFGLRRAAIGVVRILLERKLELDLTRLIAQALQAYPTAAPTLAQEIKAYIFERLKYYYLEQGVEVNLFNAVHEMTVTNLAEFERRLKAVQAFVTLPAASNLAEANKRVKNILTKQNALHNAGKINESLLQEAAEKTLYQAIVKKASHTQPLLQQKNYAVALTSLAELQQPIDQFFTEVMVMTDDVAVRDNRLSLLNKLRNLFLTVADISQLSA